MGIIYGTTKSYVKSLGFDKIKQIKQIFSLNDIIKLLKSKVMQVTLKTNNIDEIYIELNKNYDFILFPYKIVEQIIKTEAYLDKDMLRAIIRYKIIPNYLTQFSKKEDILLIYDQEFSKMNNIFNIVPLSKKFKLKRKKSDGFKVQKRRR